MLVCHISFAQIKKIGLTHPIKPSLNTLYTIIKSAIIKHITTTKYTYYNKSYYNKNDYCGNTRTITSIH